MERLFAAWARTLERVFPDPFSLALLLTVVTFVAALVATPHGMGDLVSFWGTGLWDFLEFAMQMALILVTGQALAEAPAVSRLLGRLSSFPGSTVQGVGMVSVVAMVCAWLNWGFGLIVGAILARQVADSLASRIGEERVSRGLLGAAGYTGLAFWHGGVSGSAPLSVAQPGHFLEEQIGVIELTSTVFSPGNLVLSLVLLILMPLFLVTLSRFGLATTGERVPERPAAEVVKTVGRGERVLTLIIVLLALYWWFAYREGLGLNTVIFAFLFLGMLAHGSCTRYARALDEAVGGISGIVLQFPFYAGIIGVASGSGLVGLVSTGFVEASQAVQQSTGFQPFLIFVFLSAGLANLFVPSGGGQWMIQGPIVMSAAGDLGVDPGATILAVSYGDQWTNLLQPFWALPLLSITGLKPAQLLSVTTLLLLWEGMIVAVALCLY